MLIPGDSTDTGERFRVKMIRSIQTSRIKPTTQPTTYIYVY